MKFIFNRSAILSVMSKLVPQSVSPGSSWYVPEDLPLMKEVAPLIQIIKDGRYEATLKSGTVQPLKPLEHSPPYANSIVPSLIHEFKSALGTIELNQALGGKTCQVNVRQINDQTGTVSIFSLYRGDAQHIAALLEAPIRLSIENEQSKIAEDFRQVDDDFKKILQSSSSSKSKGLSM